LFRHLHDARELRKNPIARHVLGAANAAFFKYPKGGDATESITGF